MNHEGSSTILFRKVEAIHIYDHPNIDEFVYTG